MEITTLMQTLPAVGAIILIVIKFLQHLKEERETFTNTINNHLEHSAKAIDENTKAIANLDKTNSELCIYIKSINGKKRK